jgi:hypothetical protein
LTTVPGIAVGQLQWCSSYAAFGLTRLPHHTGFDRVARRSVFRKMTWVNREMA